MFKKMTLVALLFLCFGKVCQAKDMLIIGDSHSCGPFGVSIVNELSLQGYKVDIYCAVSSTPANWIEGTTPKNQTCKSWSSGGSPSACGSDGKVPQLDRILSRKHYDSAIMAFGTNSLGSSSVDSNYKSMANKIKMKINSCLWVGPPHLRADQAKGFSPEKLTAMEKNLSEFYKSLGSSISGLCSLHDSQRITAKNAKADETVDGVHRTEASGAAWAKNVLDARFRLVEPVRPESPKVAPSSGAAR